MCHIHLSRSPPSNFKIDYYDLYLRDDEGKHTDDPVTHTVSSRARKSDPGTQALNLNLLS